MYSGRCCWGISDRHAFFLNVNVVKRLNTERGCFDKCFRGDCVDGLAGTSDLLRGIGRLVLLRVDTDVSPAKQFFPVSFGQLG